MLTRKKAIMAIVVGMAMLVFAGGANAVITSEKLENKKDLKEERKVEIETKKEERKEAVEEKKDSIKEKRCEQIKEKVKKRIERFELNNKYHQKNFNLIQKNIDELIVLFKKEGLDTKNLESYLTVLESKLEKLYESHETFLEALETSTEVDCVNIEEGIKNKFQIAKTEGELVRNNILEVKNYYKDVLRPELIRLKQLYLEAIGYPELDGDSQETEDEDEEDDNENN